MTNGPEAPDLGGPTGPGAQVGEGRAAKEPVTRAGEGLEALGRDIVEEIDKGVEELEEEISSLRKVFAKRRLSVRTMGRPLRLATVGAGASLFASVMLMALRGLGGTSVYLGTQDGAVTTVAQPIFIASLVLVSIGFGYVLTAATLAGPWLAATTLTGLVFLVGLYTGAFGQLIGGLNLFSIMPRWAHWSGRALLAAIVLLAIGGRLAIKLHDKNPDLRHERLEHHHLVPAMIVAFSILVGGYLTVIAVAMPTIGNLNLYGETIYIIFGSLAWLMWPILLVAAVDFGEWGQITGERVANAVPSRRPALLLWLTAAASLALGVFAYLDMHPGSPLFSSSRGSELGRSLLLVALGLLVVLGIGHFLGLRSRTWPEALNFASIAAVCAVFSLVIPPAVVALTGTFQYHAPPVVNAAGHYEPGADVVRLTGGSGRAGFTTLVPRGWLTQANTQVSSAIMSNPKGGYERAAFAVLPQVTMAQLVQALHLTAEAVRPDGAWQEAAARGASLQAMLWLRPVGQGLSGDYLIYGTVTGRSTMSSSLPYFEAFVNSFRGAGETPAVAPPAAENDTPAAQQQAAADREFSIATGIAAALSVLLLAVVAWRGRRWSPQVVATILLMAVVTLCGALDFLDEIGRYLFGPSTHFPYLGRDGLLAAIAIIGLATVAYLHWRPAAAGAPADGNSAGLDSGTDARGTGGGGNGEDLPAKGRGPERDPRRRSLTALLGLEVAVATLYLMDWLYAKALAAATISLWAAVILLVAIAWDITMSGESLTNRSSPQMPRTTRVLGFLGYAIALSGTVLFYSDQHTLAGGKAVHPYFEPESITQSGLFRIAFPVLVLLLLLKLSGGRGAPAAGEAGAGAPSPEELPAGAEGAPSEVALAAQI